MRVVAGCLCLGLIQVLVSRNGRASDDDWKDGCPAFFPKESPPDYISGLPVNEGNASFGVLPEIDSPLGSSRLASEGWIGRLTQQSAPDGKPDFVAAGQAMVQFNLSSGPMFALRTAAGEAFGGSDGDRYHVRATSRRLSAIEILITYLVHWHGSAARSAWAVVEPSAATTNRGSINVNGWPRCRRFVRRCLASIDR